MRPKKGHERGLRREFQFTHPGKGATSSVDECLAYSHRFNSRTLGRVRLTGVVPSELFGTVSIHAPWEGCDSIRSGTPYVGDVSIHAPWEGCDGQWTHDHQSGRSFNSRTLGRVRLTLDVPSLNYLQFQFTHPGKGATARQEGT